MLTTGDWITPHINGARYLDKPPALARLWHSRHYEGGGLLDVC